MVDPVAIKVSLRHRVSIPSPLPLSRRERGTTRSIAGFIGAGWGIWQARIIHRFARHRSLTPQSTFATNRFVCRLSASKTNEASSPLESRGRSLASFIGEGWGIWQARIIHRFAGHRSRTPQSPFASNRFACRSSASKTNEASSPLESRGRSLASFIGEGWGIWQTRIIHRFAGHRSRTPQSPPPSPTR